MLFDASFAIDLLDGRPEAVELAASLDREGQPLRLPAPVLFELWVGAHTAVRRPAERQRIEQFVLAYAPVEFDAEGARAAGRLQASMSRLGRSLGTVDAQLAGMALARSEALVTGNQALAGLSREVPIRSYRRPAETV